MLASEAARDFIDSTTQAPYLAAFPNASV